MSFVNPPKYKELEEAITSRSFPIILHGPSGAGKSYTVKEILNRLCVKYKEIDLSVTTITKPLDKNVVFLVQLYSLPDLERVIYRNNVIIESNISYLDKLQKLNKLDGFRLIKFNRITARQMKMKGFNHFDGNLFNISSRFKMTQYFLEIYHFLGKIFYRKILIKNISIGDGQLFVDLNRNELGGNKLNGNELGDIKGPIKRVTKINTKKPSKKWKSVVKINKRQLIESSETEEDSSTLSSNSSLNEIDEAILFTDSMDNDLFVSEENPARNMNTNGSVCKHKLMSSSVAKNVINEHKIVMAFDKNKIISYLYENMIDFGDLDTLRHFFDCLSCCDRNEINILTLIQCILEKPHSFKNNPSFRSMNGEAFDLM